MKYIKKIIKNVASIMLSLILMITCTLFGNKTDYNVQVATRTIELSQSALNVQNIFDTFEDVALVRKGEVVYFEGYKTIDSNVLSNVENISKNDKKNLENSYVKYNFAYDTETNTVTIFALATLKDGTIQIDEIKGIGFLNDRNEIDAVMNVDGEGILLSEMRNAEMIENCGWFSKIIKNIAKAVTIVAVATIAIAAIVVTAGTAAPAVVAAGVGVSTTVVSSAVATATAIGTYAAITAAIASGVALTVETVERYYPGCGAFEEYEDGAKVLYATWNTATINLIKEILDNNLKNNSEEIYFSCYGMKCNPIYIRIKPINFNSMKLKMRLGGFSSLTAYSIDAYSVMRAAFPFCDVSETDEYQKKSSNFIRHYHARNIIDNVIESSHLSVFDKVKQQYFTPHSYFLYS